MAPAKLSDVTHLETMQKFILLQSALQHKSRQELYNSQKMFNKINYMVAQYGQFNLLNNLVAMQTFLANANC